MAFRFNGGDRISLYFLFPNLCPKAKIPGFLGMSLHSLSGILDAVWSCRLLWNVDMMMILEERCRSESLGLFIWSLEEGVFALLPSACWFFSPFSRLCSNGRGILRRCFTWTEEQAVRQETFPGSHICIALIRRHTLFSTTACPCASIYHQICLHPGAGGCLVQQDCLQGLI